MSIRHYATIIVCKKDWAKIRPNNFRIRICYTKKHNVKLVLCQGPRMFIVNSSIRRRIDNSNLHHVPDNQKYGKASDKSELGRLKSIKIVKIVNFIELFTCAYLFYSFLVFNDYIFYTKNAFMQH